MNIILPEKVEPSKLNVGDVLSTPFRDIYILSKFTNGKYAWFSFKGACANGIYDSLGELEASSGKFRTEIGYKIYKSTDYNLKLVPKGE